MPTRMAFCCISASTGVVVTAWPASLVSLAALENGHLSCPAPLLHISSGSGSVAGLAKPASLESPLSPTLPGSEKGAFHVIASPSRCALNNLTHKNNPTPTSPTSALRSTWQRSTTISALPLINPYSFSSSACSTVSGHKSTRFA
jgi:hypothetical protein